MITEDKRSVVVRYWFEKAEKSRTSARREFEAGSLSFAMNRLYYGPFMRYRLYGWPTWKWNC